MSSLWVVVVVVVVFGLVFKADECMSLISSCAPFQQFLEKFLV